MFNDKIDNQIYKLNVLCVGPLTYSRAKSGPRPCSQYDVIKFNLLKLLILG